VRSATQTLNATGPDCGVAMKIILTIDIKDGPDTLIKLIKILQAVGADTRIQIEPSSAKLGCTASRGDADVP
jgi:hypothetical protein